MKPEPYEKYVRVKKTFWTCPWPHHRHETEAEATSCAQRSSGKPLSEFQLLELTTRTENTLLAAGIRSVAQLISCAAVDLLKLPNFGPRSLQEVRECLELQKLSLRDEDGKVLVMAEETQQ